MTKRKVRLFRVGRGMGSTLIAVVMTISTASASMDQRKQPGPQATVSLSSNQPLQKEEQKRTSRNRAALDRYYSALQRKNADELRSAIEEGFASDAVLRVSDSLPYGGTYSGREVILKMLMGFVTTTTPIIKPEEIKIESVVEEGDAIVAKASFPWLAPGGRKPIPMSAFESFKFRDGRITEMVVSYWDTAACLEAMKAAKANR